MKKVLLIALAVIVTAGLVGFMVYKQQSGYTKVLTAKLVKQDLATVVSGTGQIRPKTLCESRRHRDGPHHPPLCEGG